MATTMRKCSGSKTFGIEAHEAPPADFPAQPSRKDGLGVMCKPHWNQYTSALRKAALARRALEADQGARAAKAAGGVSACSKTVGKRTCVAGAEGHAGPHDWPKTATAKAPRQSKAALVATESLGGKAYTDAAGSDEVQAALEGAGQEDTFESDVRAILT